MKRKHARIYTQFPYPGVCYLTMRPVDCYTADLAMGVHPTEPAYFICHGRDIEKNVPFDRALRTLVARARKR